MEASTESLLNTAMDLNAEIQEDNLTMYEMCNSMCEKANECDTLQRVAKAISNNGVDKLTLSFLDATLDFSNKCGVDKDDILGMSIADRKSCLIGKINAYCHTTRESIGRSLRSMLNACIKDLDSVCKFDKVEKVANESIVVYNKLAYENITKSIKSVIDAVASSANCKDSLKTLAAKLKANSGLDMSLINTKISNEGFVSMDIPQPQIQNVKDAGLGADSMNKVSHILNNLITKEDMSKLAQFTLNVNHRVDKAESVVDEIRFNHLVAQVLMAAKNSLMLVKNYHTATIDACKKINA